MKGIMQIADEINNLAMGSDTQQQDCECDLCDDTGSLENNDGFTSPCECNADDEDMSGSCRTNDR